MNGILKIIVNIVLFVIFMFLIVKGHSQQTLGHLGKMMIGVFGLIGLLWNYNRFHR